jgi:hypothetical protein
MKTKIPVWQTDNFWLGLYTLIILFLSVKEMFFEPQNVGLFKFGNGNFSIFYHSFHHLIEGKTLYGFYPQEYENRFNYGPLFAVLMSPFSILPYPIAGILWNLGNGLLFFSGIKQLSNQSNKRFFLYWFVIFEAYTALINFQTNVSLAGVLIWTVIFWERKQYFWAAAMLMLGTWTKILGLLVGIFWFFYPQKIRFILYCLFWSLIFFGLPLFFISFNQLIFLYQEWFFWLTKHNEIHGNTIGLLSIHALFQRLLGININNGIWILMGLVALLGSIIYKRKNLADIRLKMLTLANVLLFLTIFNPAAESPTYVIAMAGVGLWFIYSPASKWHIGLAIFAFVLTGLSQTDLFPAYLRDNFTRPYALKALPCVVIWAVSVIELYLYQPNQNLDTSHFINQ